MPTVPTNRNLLSTEILGTPNVSAGAGSVADATARLGQIAQTVGASLAEDIKKAEAQDAVSKAYYDDFLASEDYRQKLKLSSPDGYIYENGQTKVNSDGTKRTITQEYRDWANDRFEKNQSSMPSLVAQRLYQERLGDFYTKQIGGLKDDEHLLMVNSFNASADLNQQKLSDNLVSIPSVEKAYEFSNSLSLDIRGQVGRLYSDPIASEKVLKSNQKLADSLFDGAYVQVISEFSNKSSSATQSVAYWKNVLNGEDAVSRKRKELGLPTLSDMLSEPDKARHLLQFANLKEKASDIDRTQFNTLVSEAGAAAKLGKGSPEQLVRIVSMADQLITERRLFPEEKAKILAGLSADRSYGKYMNGPAFYFASPSEKSVIIEKASKDAKSTAQQLLKDIKGAGDVGSSAESEIRSALSQEAQQQITKAQHDFAAFAESGDKSIQANLARADFSNPVSLGDKGKFIQSAVTKSKMWHERTLPGQPQFFRVIDKGRSAQVAKTLMDPTYSTQNTAQAIKSLAKAYGPHFPELMNEMIKDGHLHEGWRFAAIMTNSLSTEDVVTSLKARNEVFDKNFKVMAQGRGVTEADFETAVSKEVAPLIAAWTQQRPNEVFQANQIRMISEVVKTRAMQRFMETGGVVGYQDAAKQAAQSLIHNQVHLQEVGGGFFGKGQKSMLAIPKQVGNTVIGPAEKDQITAYINSHLEPKALKTLGVIPPPQASGKPGKFDDQFYEQVVATGRFTLAPNQQGFHIWYTDRQANRDVQAHRLDKQGKPVPILVPIQDVLRWTPEKRTSPASSLPLFFPGGKQ